MEHLGQNAKCARDHVQFINGRLFFRELVECADSIQPKCFILQLHRDVETRESVLFALQNALNFNVEWRRLNYNKDTIITNKKRLGLTVYEVISWCIHLSRPMIRKPSNKVFNHSEARSLSLLWIECRSFLSSNDRCLTALDPMILTISGIWTNSWICFETQ